MLLAGDLRSLTTGGLRVTRTLFHAGNAVRGFYAALEGSVVVRIEATGAMQRFLDREKSWASSVG
jgi:hypothetical protein